MKRIISLLLLFALCVLGTSCGVVVPPSEGESELQAAAPTPKVEEGMVLLSIEAEPHLSDGSSSDPFVKTLKATVYPDTAHDKYVSWSIAWADGVTRTDPVTDYVTVVPTEAGSTTARVTCLKAFPEDTAVVTVRTRVGGYTARCTVSYLGTPETIAIDTDALASNAAKVDGDKYIFEAYEDTGTMPNWIPVLMNNRFSNVGAAQWSDVELSVQMHGSITANCTTEDKRVDGSIVSVNADAYASRAFIEDGYICTTFTMPSSDYFYAQGYLVPVEDVTLRLFKLEYSSGYQGIGITGLNNMFLYDDTFGADRETGFNTFDFTHAAPYEYSTVYFTLTFTHASTGLSTSIDLVLNEGVTAVALDSSGIVF